MAWAGGSLGPPVVLLALLAAGHAGLLGPPSLRALAATLLLVLLPGLAAVFALLPGAHLPEGEVKGHDLDGADRLVLAAAAGLALFVYSALLWSYRPAPFEAAPVLLTADALTLLGLLLAWRRRATLAPWRVEPRFALALLGVLAVAAWFRLANLGYSELESDEAQVVLKGVALAQGGDNPLFLHQKGPAEILLATATALLAADATEGTLRLPFALVSLLGPLALYALGRRWLGGSVALLAALLFALNGFAIGFGRIVQYQSLVLLLTLAGLLAFARASPGPRPALAPLALAALVFAAGLLTHWDIVFAVPPLLALAVAAACRWRWRPAALAPLLLAGLGGLALAAVFYLPYAHHPFAASTAKYLAGRRGDELLYDNLERIAVYTTFYNAVYYAALLAAGLMAALWRVWPRLGGPRWARRLLGAAVGGAVLLAVGLAATTNTAQPVPVLAVVGVLLLLLLALLRAPALSAPTKALWLWLLLPALLFTYFTFRPGTHFYVVFPPLSLLAAAGLVSLTRPAAEGERGRPARQLRPATVAGSLLATLLLLLSAAYLQVAFVSHQPEYRRSFPASKLALFPVLTDRLPERDWFGFPYQAGWRAAAVLYDRGMLAGPYASNEVEPIRRWYTRDAAFCQRPSSWTIAAQAALNRDPLPPELVDERRLAYVVTIEGRPNLRVYRPEGAPAAPPARVDVADLAPAFARLSTDWRFDTGVRDEPYVPSPLDVDLTPDLLLLGYRLRHDAVPQSSALDLTLYLVAHTRPSADYAFDLTLGEEVGWEGRQHRSPCDTRRPTHNWRPGDYTALHHLLPLPAGLAPGDYPLTLLLRLEKSAEVLRRQPLGSVTVLPAATDSTAALWVQPRS